MKTRRLGSLQASAIGLGCMSMTPIYGEPSEPEAIATIHRALEIGVTMIDTADMYGEDGSNEALVGRALKGRRDRAVLASKFGNIRTPGGGRAVNGKPEYVPQACEATLKAARRRPSRSLLPAPRRSQRVDRGHGRRNGETGEAG